MEATEVTTQIVPCDSPLPKLEVQIINTMVTSMGSEHRKLNEHISQLAFATTGFANDLDALTRRFATLNPISSRWGALANTRREAAARTAEVSRISNPNRQFHSVRALDTNYHTLAVSFDKLAEKRFAGAVSVKVGGVDEISAGLAESVVSGAALVTCS